MSSYKKSYNMWISQDDKHITGSGSFKMVKCRFNSFKHIYTSLNYSYWLIVCKKTLRKLME